MLKIIFLFLAIAFSFINVGRLIAKQYISLTNIFLMAMGITGFIVLQFNLI